jgi:hypothetical protein
MANRGHNIFRAKLVMMLLAGGVSIRALLQVCAAMQVFDQADE